MTEKEKRGREHVAAWKASGLTQRRYCEGHHYSRSVLGYWSWKINNEKQVGSFIEVSTGGNRRVDSSEAMVELDVGDHYRLRLTDGFSSAAVKRLLDVLESR